MDNCFALEVLPDETDLEVEGDVDETFVLDANDDIFRPGEDNEIIRPRRN